ncbi:HlyD family type I secretion periplasmic adaptor subunit [Acidimangrovimonas sediminis]|uniref:HlyD family type I secretion periplasmic adaptor subunit n=1 Tax=Acidimangrovimonas sediminis TaxID=2056283 RepID=UPI000C80540F|nr:HlyD family type I secretion periplasmic adaptor subunit [Acidimangrovimonas sediminis]
MRSRKTKAAEGFALRGRLMVAGVLLAGLVGLCGGWAVQAKLSGAVIAHGEVVVRAQLKHVQHPDGGIIRAILVENGDKVRAGQVVMRLEDTQLRAEAAMIDSQIAEFSGRRARLIAARDGVDEIAFPAGFDTDPATAPVAAGERRVHLQDRAMQVLRRDQMQSQIGQLEEQIHALEAQQIANASQRRLRAADFERQSSLLSRKLVDVGRVSEIERDLAQLDGKAGEIKANIARLRGQISETRLRLLEIDHQARTEAQKDLRDIDAKLAELAQRAIAARDRLSRTEIRAPIAGVVTDLAVHSEKGVIAPGERVMSVVPEGELLVEARLPVTDIDQVRVGQAVRLRFSAFNQRTTPEVAGEVAVVAAAASTGPADGVSYYLTSVRMTEAAALPEGRRLVPGMPVEVFFQTGQRSALSYLVKPVADQVSRSMRED